MLQESPGEMRPGVLLDRLTGRGQGMPLLPSASSRERILRSWWISLPSVTSSYIFLQFTVWDSSSAFLFLSFPLSLSFHLLFPCRFNFYGQFLLAVLFSFLKKQNKTLPFSFLLPLTLHTILFFSLLGWLCARARACVCVHTCCTSWFHISMHACIPILYYSQQGLCGVLR